MDGFDTSKGLLVLAATNRPEVLDKALLRPGRFDRRIIVDRPDMKGRLETLKVHSKDVAMDESVDLQALALASAGLVGSDLANIINEAAINAVKHNRKFVNQNDLFEAFELVAVGGKEKKDRIMSDKERKIVSYHEVGHALVSALQKNTEPVQKITIVPRTMGALGYTLQTPEEEKYLETKDELIARITTYMAGRAAEEIVFESYTSGAANDIENATNMPEYGNPVRHVRQVRHDGSGFGGEPVSGRQSGSYLRREDGLRDRRRGAVHHQRLLRRGQASVVGKPGDSG